jgi:hypothetical protein
MRHWWRKTRWGGPRESSAELQAQSEILSTKIDTAADKILDAVAQLRIEVDRLAQIKREEKDNDGTDTWTIE